MTFLTHYARWTAALAILQAASQCVGTRPRDEPQPDRSGEDDGKPSKHSDAEPAERVLERNLSGGLAVNASALRRDGDRCPRRAAKPTIWRRAQ
jgi:hypothetical protein